MSEKEETKNAYLRNVRIKILSLENWRNSKYLRLLQFALLDQNLMVYLTEGGKAALDRISAQARKLGIYEEEIETALGREAKWQVMARHALNFLVAGTDDIDDTLFPGNMFVVKRIEELYHAKAIPAGDKDNEAIYVYDRVYNPDSEADLKEFVQGYFEKAAERMLPLYRILQSDLQSKVDPNKEDATQKEIDEKLKKIRTEVAEAMKVMRYGISTFKLHEILNNVRRRNYANIDLFDENPQLIAVTNCVLEIKEDLTVVTRDFSPSLLLTVQHDVVYDPDAKCPQWEKFIKESVYESDVQMLQEYAGYTLWKEFRRQKVLLTLGPPGAGKGTTISIMEGIHTTTRNRRLTAEIHLSQLADPKRKGEFDGSDWFGKSMLTDPELSQQPFIDMSTPDKIFGGNRIALYRKFKEIVYYLPFFKGWFAGNVPAGKVSVEQWFRRVLIVRYKLRKGEEDPDLKDKLLMEKSGIFNWMLEGLIRLIRNGWRFTGELNLEKTIDLYDNLSNTVLFFKELCVSKSINNKVRLDDAYDSYLNLCEVEKLIPTDRKHFKNLFGKAVKEDGFELVRETTGDRGYYYSDMAIVVKSPEDLENERKAAEDARRKLQKEQEEQARWTARRNMIEVAIQKELEGSKGKTELELLNAMPEEENITQDELANVLEHGLYETENNHWCLKL